MRTQFFIFSGSLASESSETNKQATDMIKKCLSGNPSIVYRNVDGCYKGSTEQSFLVDAKHEEVVMHLAKMTRQESVLFVDRKGGAHLIYPGMGYLTEKLSGKFQEVDRDKALELDNFTRDASTNTYWAVV